MSTTDRTAPTLGAVWLVARREITTRMATKAYRITTVVMVAAILGLVYVPRLIGGESGSTVGFTPPVAALAQPFTSVADAVGEEVTVQTVDQAQGEAQVVDGTLDALITGTPDALQVIVHERLSPVLSNALTVLVRQVVLSNEIAAAGGDPAAVAAAVEAAKFEVRALEPPPPLDGQRILISVIVGVLVYFSLMLYGQTVAQGVVEEKTSRVVELLLTTIRPWQLMLGKVVGIGIVGLAQLVLVVGAGAAAAIATDTLDFPTGQVGGIVIWSIFWYLLGFLVYALMFASLGALVSRQEDVGGAVTPPIMLLVIPYVVGITALPADPDNQIVAVLSLIPVFSPTLMPMRIAVGVAPVWEIALSVGLTVALAVALVWFSGRIYGNAVLRMGSKVRLRDALRATS